MYGVDHILFCINQRRLSGGADAEGSDRVKIAALLAGDHHQQTSYSNGQIPVLRDLILLVLYRAGFGVRLVEGISPCVHGGSFLEKRIGGHLEVKASAR